MSRPPPSAARVPFVHDIGISSTGSVSQQPPAVALVDSDDPAWRYCSLPNIAKRHHLKCNYCDKVCTSGITRIKFHLSCIKNHGTSKQECIEQDGQFRAAVITCITKMIDDVEIQDMAIEELKKYKGQADSFGEDIAIRQRRNKNFDPANWWLNHGTCAPNLRALAMKILSLTCSSSACERNWSAFEQVHAKKRNRLRHGLMRDLVFVKFNSRIIQKRANKRRDPIEKDIDDVLEDEDNEFVTGIVPIVEYEDSEQVQAEETEVPQAEHIQASQRASTSGAQANKKRTVPPRKKRKRSMHSLLNCIQEEPMESSSSSSEEDNQAEDDDIDMDPSDSDKSNSHYADSD